MKSSIVFLTLGIALADDTARREKYAELANLVLEPAQHSTKAVRRANSQQGWQRPDPLLAMRHIQALHDLVTPTVLDALQQGDDNRAERVRTSILDLQSGFQERSDHLPYAQQTSIRGQEAVTVAFSIMQGASAIPEPEPFIQFYVSAHNVRYLAAEAPPDFSGRGVQVQQLRSLVENQIWVLAWGQRYGDNRARVIARLYAFDGGSVRTLWGRDDLLGGSIGFRDQRITVTFYDPARRGLGPPEREEYQITPHGVTRVW
jgi:hypothetical protein